MALTIPSRTPWEDRFRTPTATDLRSALAPQFLATFDHARARIAHIPGAVESIRWRGVWKWTFEYVCASEPTAEAFAFLVPDPAKPRLCISVSDACLTGLDQRKLPKGVREVLAAAPAVDGVRWVTWDVASKSGVDEIAAFVVAYRTARGLPMETTGPTNSPVAKSRETKPKPASNSKQANGTAASSTSHKARANGTRRTRGA